MNEQIHQLLNEIGPGKMSSTAYDTAWVARLGEIDWDLSSRALNWLCENQLPDGSWGAEKPFYYHDRVISTLAAMIALTHRGRRAHDKAQIEKGLLALERITSGATQGLQADPNGATVGFEMIIPTLVAEAENLGLIKQQSDRILGRLQFLREKKIEMIKGYKINRFITPSFSIEMVGSKNLELLQIDELQEKNGSIANSPSATAFYLINVNNNNQKAVDYLRKWMQDDGGIPNFAPIDIFEIGWSLWNIKLIPELDDITLGMIKPSLDFLYANWDTGVGIGTASGGTLRDSDDSSLVFEILHHFGYEVDVNAILNYEEENFFRCFSLEANPSISANIHVLGALKQAGLGKNHDSIKKVLNFLQRSQQHQGYWFDKWHASPYYSTSHAIIALIGLDDVLCNNAVEWLLRTQKADGSWGFYNMSTAEESAYALQALYYWQRYKGRILNQKIDIGLHWLKQEANCLQDTLWIGKALYSPTVVTRSSIISTLELLKQR